jgi:O-antigen/teichoic acid export membrane protein
MFSRDLIIVLAQRSWQAFAGFFTTIFIAKFLSPSEQGWYYTFISVAALYVLFELGVSSAIAQIASRMFIDLSWDDLEFKEEEKQKKFFAFFLSSVRYYLVIAFVFFFVVSLAGYQFFLRSASSIHGSDGWVLPWICLILITAINLITLPVMSIVEGSGQVSEVYLLRLMQGIAIMLGCPDVRGWYMVHYHAAAIIGNCFLNLGNQNKSRFVENAQSSTPLQRI